ncbi:MAG: YceH family protein [Gammaproteobacteria bacterium]
MSIELDTVEARVIASLIEKAITTPDQYPLSINALTNACNQKSNRHPVMQVTEATVQSALGRLVKRHLVIQKSGFGSRVPKFQHLFCNTPFGTLQLSPRELGIICELLLRGAQTPGELRSRAVRLCPLHAVQEVEATLEGLMTREGGPFVAKLAREPGRRESRYRHLFGDASAEVLDAEPDAISPASFPDEERFARLEARVAALEQALASLRGEPSG